MYSNTIFQTMIDNIDDEILYEDMMDEIFETVLQSSTIQVSQDDEDDEEIVWIPDHLDKNMHEYWMI